MKDSRIICIGAVRISSYGYGKLLYNIHISFKHKFEELDYHLSRVLSGEKCGDKLIPNSNDICLL